MAVACFNDVVLMRLLGSVVKMVRSAKGLLIKLMPFRFHG